MNRSAAIRAVLPAHDQAPMSTGHIHSRLGMDSVTAGDVSSTLWQMAHTGFIERVGEGRDVRWRALSPEKYAARMAQLQQAYDEGRRKALENRRARLAAMPKVEKPKKVRVKAPKPDLRPSCATAEILALVPAHAAGWITSTEVAAALGVNRRFVSARFRDLWREGRLIREGTKLSFRYCHISDEARAERQRVMREKMRAAAQSANLKRSELARERRALKPVKPKPATVLPRSEPKDDRPKFRDMPAIVPEGLTVTVLPGPQLDRWQATGDGPFSRLGIGRYLEAA